MGDDEDEEDEEEGEGEREAEEVPVASEVTHTIRIIRLPGKGLGISIAGGQGSTPYKGDDEVRLFSQG